MPKAPLNEIELYYEEHGKGETLVLIPGFGADHTVWTTVLNLFSTRYHVITLDNRGAGQSHIPSGPYTIKQMAEDIYELFQYLHINRAHVLGHSMGGYIAQYLSHTYPESVASMILTNSVMGNKATAFHFYLKAQLELLKQNLPREALIKAALTWIYSSHFLQETKKINSLIYGLLNTKYPFSISGYKGQLAALESFNSDPWIRSIKVPSLIIGSNQDLIFNEGLIKDLAEALSGSEYYGFDEVGHTPFIEKPKEFFEVVDKFISKHEIELKE